MSFSKYIVDTARVRRRQPSGSAPTRLRGSKCCCGATVATKDQHADSLAFAPRCGFVTNSIAFRHHLPDVRPCELGPQPNFIPGSRLGSPVSNNLLPHHLSPGVGNGWPRVPRRRTKAAPALASSV
jgi:hypothetical protein